MTHDNKRFTMLLLIGTLLAALMMALASSAQAVAGVQDAVCKIGRGCSAVCVDPTGIILSAKHCDLRETETIHFPNHPPIEGRRIYVDELAEGIVAFDVAGDGWAFSPVAASVPMAGESVESWGYPGKAGGRLIHAAGKITGGSADRIFLRNGIPQGKFAANDVDFPTAPGWSGGPLFNEAGEVIGILTAGDARSSMFISWAATRKAYEAATRQSGTRQPIPDIEKSPLYVRKPHVLFFGFDGCKHCIPVHRDIKNGRLDDLNIEYVDVLTPEGGKRFAALGAAIEEANPSFRFKNEVPAFHRSGEAIIVYGYRGDSRSAGRLLRWGLETIRVPLTLTEGLMGLIYPDRDAGGTEVPPTPVDPIGENTMPSEVPPMEDSAPKQAATPEKVVRPTEPTKKSDKGSPLMLMLLAAGAALLEIIVGRRAVK